jgi:exosome complex RNA-binding protein Rrp42 (RNase PH superfamily)
MGARVTIAINKAGLFCGIVKGGGGGLDPTAFCAMLGTAKTIGAQILATQERLLEQEQQNVATQSSYSITGFPL